MEYTTLSIPENEKKLIELALKKHDGNRAKASHELEISTRTLYRKLKEYRILELGEYAIA